MLFKVSVLLKVVSKMSLRDHEQEEPSIEEFKSNGWTCTKSETSSMWECEHEDGGNCGTSAAPEWCTDGGTRMTILILSLFVGIPLLLFCCCRFCAIANQPEQVN